MLNFIKKLFLFFIVFFSFSLCAFAEDIKINGIMFDESDGIIYLQTKNNLDNAAFKKGYLTNPKRIYLDVENAVLTTLKKTYTGKNSIFNSVKISQFSTNPNVVRLVFEYNSKFKGDFDVYKNSNSLFIKTNQIVDNARTKTAFSDVKTNERTPYYNPASYFEQQNDEHKKMASSYYVDSISKTDKGILIHGLGQISLMSPFLLTDPNRYVLDFDDTVLNPEIRNVSFDVPQIGTVKLGQNTANITRLVINSDTPKDFRAIISPDSQNLYITKKSNIIESKIADNTANLLQADYSNLKGLEIISLKFDDSVSFCVFEENSKLYLDILNLNPFNDAIIQPLSHYIPNLETTRLALDKFRISIPKTNDSNNRISVKTTPDNLELKIYAKKIKEIKPKVTITPAQKTKAKNSKYKVVIDPGHGGSDVGATRNNIYEKDITLSVSKMVEENLKKLNVATYMTRDTDKTVSLSERSEFSNKIKPDAFVSIHVNSSLNDGIKGIETHYYKDNSIKLANSVQNEFQKNVKNWKTTDRGLFKSQFYVINHTDAPSILCETGFISNSKERGELNKQKHQSELAKAISDGIYNYLKGKK